MEPADSRHRASRRRCSRSATARDHALCALDVPEPPVTIDIVLALLLRTAEFLFYHLLLSVVDRVSRLPRDTTLPEAMRLYRENIALKAQLDALERHLGQLEAKGKGKLALRVRAAQVFALLLTRGNEPFQRYFLSASRRTILRWASKFRWWWRRPPACGGRPELDAKIVELIVTLKRDNPSWGRRRIRQELRRMGIRVSEPTITRVLLEHGFTPHPGRRMCFDRVRSAAKDALWALDFFAVQTAKGVWLQALLVIDIHTRELLDLRVHDGWDVDSRWTIRAFNAIVGRTGRKPIAVVHDHGPHFMGQFRRQLRVLQIGEELTPPGLPSMNCYAESAIGSIRRELLRHIRVADATELQYYLDECRRYRNEDRAHQGIDGQTPSARAGEEPVAEALSMVELGRRRLVRRDYAHGLLQGYSLVANDVAPRAA